ncbi:hypothetical protein CHLNCDRAFT_136848 [Chlorella variabilis]|uniref:phytol kinase n=1 Tax=Chlorella variabilis TaxID=554065 RepID=E1ZL69_CHLVA|nr:hypothetical protein CHLNCDRAFT_136848 [Chlorella variabilis]EFN53508.1 hypothetical protein CHLNCDRAFT_136848 [Chlorella variabilis]|eukprot:XP_005845610.1 hypothetical protein CHLNCDRAFT_136848 [Chlorella variabilis]
MDSLVTPLEQMAAARWNGQQAGWRPQGEGLDADGQPLPGAPHLNLLYRDFAVSALTCCNPACANLASGSEGALSRSKCARCRRASYCGRGCQLEDWPRLKAACRHMDLL